MYANVSVFLSVGVHAHMLMLTEIDICIYTLGLGCIPNIYTHIYTVIFFSFKG